MKRTIIMLILVLSIGCTAGIRAQQHRHNPQRVQVLADTDTMGIEAFSDTTSVDTASMASPSVGDDDQTDDWMNRNITPSDLKDLLHLGLGGTLLGIIAVLAVLLFFAAPFLLLAFLIYLLFRNRNRRYRLAEKAIENGQQLPQELLRIEQQSDDYLWRRGIRNVFLGIGLAVFFSCWNANFLAGLGWLLCFYGVGQAVIAKSSRRKDKEEDVEYIDDNDLNKEQ